MPGTIITYTYGTYTTRITYTCGTVTNSYLPYLPKSLGLHQNH